MALFKAIGQFFSRWRLQRKESHPALAGTTTDGRGLDNVEDGVTVFR